MADRPTEDPTDWVFWRWFMESTGRCAAGKTAGVWALQVLERHFGQQWLTRACEREGNPPPVVSMSPSHTMAFAELLELAVALELAQGVTGAAKVRKALATDRDEARLHATLQLEMAMLARHIGADVELEPRLSRQHPPVDARIAAGGVEIPVEARVVLMDESTRAGRDLSDQISHGMLNITFCRDVHFSGSIADAVGVADVVDLLEAMDAAAALAADRLEPMRVVHPLANLTVIPGSQSTDGITFTIPAGVGQGIYRVLRTMQDKATQAARSGATWLRMDLYDGTFQLTPWSQKPLADKAAAMAQTVTSTLGQTGPFRGVVITSGRASALHASPAQSTRMGDTYGLRRNLFPLRGRETIVIPLVEDAGDESALWVGLYDDEESWLDSALGEVGLESFESLIAVDGGERPSTP